MKRKFCCISLILLIMLSLIGCSSNTKSPGHLGDYKASFLGIKTISGAENTKLVIGYEFTNYSNEAISFEKAFSPTVSQDGKILQQAYVEEGQTEPCEMLINPNETFVIDMTYYLENTDSIITIKLLNSKTNQTYEHNVAPKLF